MSSSHEDALKLSSPQMDEFIIKSIGDEHTKVDGFILVIYQVFKGTITS